MAHETDKAANATEAAGKAGERVAAYAANTTEAAAKTGERVAAYAANTTEAAAKTGERVAAETTKAGESAGASAAKAGEKVAAETADRIERASKAYSAAMGAAFKAAQDYNTKLVQVFQTNAEANLRLGQALMQTRSPADFVETMSRSVRERTDLVTEQTKELAALGRETARCAIEAIAPGR